MKGSTKAKVVSSIVFKSIWLVLAIGLWIGGLVAFNSNEDKLAGWFIWGGLCSICVIWTLLKNAGKSAKKGARDGANDYTITDHGSHYVVENHPLRGAIIGFVGGLIGGVAIGQILVPIFVIKNTIALISSLKMLKKV